MDPLEAQQARLAVVGRKDVTARTRAEIEERLLLQHWKAARKQYYARFAEEKRVIAEVTRARAAGQAQLQ